MTETTKSPTAVDGTTGSFGAPAEWVDVESLITDPISAISGGTFSTFTIGEVV